MERLVVVRCGKGTKITGHERIKKLFLNGIFLL